MRREEAIKGLKVLRKDFSGYKPNEEMFDMAIKALEQQPCEDCVSREEALMALTGIWTESRDEILSKAIRRLNSMPSVTPKEKTRKWRSVTDDTGHLAWKCDCGWQQRLWTNFCPNCGARVEVDNGSKGV